TVSGMRVADPARELADLTASLRAAGMDVRVDGTPDLVPAEYAVLVAWTLREAGTNIARHSGARRVTVEFTAGGVRVTDDGRGIGARREAGSGTAGSDTAGRGLEGLAGESRLLSGALEGPVEVPMNGAVYLADLVGGQKTGLYFDQRPNHAFVARLCEGARVLDVFSHVGGFALAALAGGAATALAVDGSEPALALASEGARRSGFGERFSVRRADAFDALGELGEAGERFEVVICDPPAFAPAKSALQNGLRAYARVARLAARVAAPGGFLTLCSCSHAADPAAFRAACVRGIEQAGREAQLLRFGEAGPDHPEHPGLPETSYLKALTFRLDG
ncbi:MAG: class I SAM-dependent methyltransferase, partial [Albimonas sp.]|uniref:class I SAM-dependent methyltransferase n=1 Tax=Albimonas sp. TaxID=1872425 RepID=UPI00405759A4